MILAVKNILYQVKDGGLCIAGNLIGPPFRVGEILEVRDLLVVRLEPPIGQLLNRNVFSYNGQGILIWVIEESPHGTELDKPYVTIKKNNNSELIASNWNGVDYAVNLDDGSIEARAFNK